MPRKRTKNHYFRKEHQDAIVEYCQTQDPKRRNELYKEFIGPVFDEMVDKIVYTYKFTSLPNIDSLKDDCKNWLITVLNNFDPEKGSKAFTYFTIIRKVYMAINRLIKDPFESFRKSVNFLVGSGGVINVDR